jgi:ABC-type oligopeptide transport system substrate-binding subunit
LRKPLRKAIILLLALTLATILLAGCAAPWPFPQPTPDPKVPDSQQILHPLEVGVANGDLETLDPALIEFNSDYDLAQLIFPGLVTLDEQGQPVDWAAERHEVSADGLTYTFHLRKGMMWSDATPIDASTFAYSINRALDPCTGSSTANYLYAIKGAQAFNAAQCPAGTLHSSATLIGSSLLVPDPLTLQISLQQPAGYFLAALTWPLSWAVPQAMIEKYPGNGYLNGWTDHLADNGGFGGNLYCLTKWDHAGHLELERNERFWGSKPVLRRIEYTLYKTIDTAWEDFIAGKGDVSQPLLTQLEVAKRLKASAVQQTPLLETAYLRPNWHIAPFDDLRIRQAFSLGIDRRALAQDAFQNTVIPSIHLVPEGMVGYNPSLVDPIGRTDKDALTPDLEKAQALANAYAAEKCGGAFAGCPALIVQGGLASVQRDNLLRQEWQTAFPGWPMFFCGVDRRCGSTQIPMPKLYQFSRSGWLADYPDPQDFLSLPWTTQAQYNQSYVSIPAVDALCAQADASSDQAVRISLYHQAEQLLVNQVAAIPLYQYTATYVVRSRVVNWRIASAGVTSLSVWQQVYVRHSL